MVVMVSECGAVMGSIGPIARRGAENHRWNDIAQMVILIRKESASF